MSDKDKCTVRRFWNSTTDEHGTLAHHPGGRWAFAWLGGDSEERISPSAGMRSSPASTLR
ncbi:MAG: hypothetical protein KIS73_08390 [Enhydrobacter sp.]|nr:hypothetical protein [Enhydrobacter sp.]